MPGSAYTLERFIVEDESGRLTIFAALLPHERAALAENPGGFSWDDYKGRVLGVVGVNPSPHDVKMAEAAFAQWKKDQTRTKDLKQTLGQKMNDDGDFVGICPVCDVRALITELPDLENCHNCGWIGSSRLPDNDSVYQGRERVTLEQAQENYRKFGAIYPPAQKR
jgi:Cysteine-rich CPCC